MPKVHDFHREVIMDRKSREVFVGIDWATKAHQVCLMDPQGKVIEEFSVDNSGEGMLDLQEELVKYCGGEMSLVKVAIEVPRGSVVSSLVSFGCRVFSVNPKQLDRFRDRHTVAGAKDDRRDSYVLADSLRTDEHLYNEVESDPESVVKLQKLMPIRSELVKEKVRLTNQLTQCLREYYPQILVVAKSADESWVLDLLAKAPTPKAGARLSKGQIAMILKKNRIRRLEVDDVVNALRRKPLFLARGVLETCSIHAKMLVARLKIVKEQLKSTDKLVEGVIEEYFEEDNRGEHRDKDTITSFPGIGKVVIGTMLAWGHRALEKRDYHALCVLTGVSPVTKRSGKTLYVIRRRACHRELNQAMYYWANVAAASDKYFKQVKQELRNRGKRNGTANRIIGRRLLMMLCAALRDGTTYDRSRFEEKIAA